jgi:hypothetical protein
MNFRQSLFWDIDPKTLNIKKHAVYIIERIMEFGKDNEVRWLWSTYKPSQLKTVASLSRALSPMTKNFWRIMLRHK